MRALLDTHAFLCFIFADAKLKASSKAAILDLNNQMLLSIASLWEIVIKVSIGKLPLNRSYADLIRLDVVSNNIEILRLPTRTSKRSRQCRCTIGIRLTE